MSSEDYKWFQIVNGNELEQGDILESCPVFSPPSNLAVESHEEATFEWNEFDLIILSQSCDLAHSNINEVMLCPILNLSELKGRLASTEGKEGIRRGNSPSLHMLNSCDLTGVEKEIRIVSFRPVYSLPIDFVREFANNKGDRTRLLPPYREHLSQAFARFFMRVGLPVDIPEFKKTS